MSFPDVIKKTVGSPAGPTDLSVNWNWVAGEWNPFDSLHEFYIRPIFPHLYIVIRKLIRIIPRSLLFGAFKQVIDAVSACIFDMNSTLFSYVKFRFHVN